MWNRLSAARLVSGLVCGAVSAGGAWGRPVSGLYIGAGAGLNVMQDQPVDYLTNAGGPGAQFRSARFDAGFAGVVSAGWGFGNGLRVELEGDYRRNGISRLVGASTSGGTESKYGAMVNALYEPDLGWAVRPYAGLGVGEQTVDWRNGRAAGPGYFIRLQHPDIVVAYQAIFGIAYDLPFPGLALTAEYRFLGAGTGHTVYGQYFAPGVARPAETRLDHDFNHSLLIGVRYAFDTPPPPVAAAAPPVAPQAASRSYLVFFDWDRADLTDRARQVVAEAAQASTRVPVTRIEVNGYTDTSGPSRYNLGLSVRRGQSVAAELVADGVPRSEIAIQGFGETHLLVATAGGVREPQNRRVEIVLR